MAQKSSDLSRRTVIGLAAGGGLVAAVALARPVLQGVGIQDPFLEPFTSPYVSLDGMDHVQWGQQVGTTVSVDGGPSLQVTDVELFAPFGAADTHSSRSRAFAVKFQSVGGGVLSEDRIYTVDHPTLGSVDLFLQAAPAQRSATAMFN